MTLTADASQTLLNDYCEGALDYLRHAYDADERLFSFSTTLGPDGAIVNDFAHPQTLRYTINTFLGLAEAERHRGAVAWLGDVREGVRGLLDRHEREIGSPADRGLLLVLLAAVAPDHPAVGRSLDAIEAALARPNAYRRLNMQDLAWMLWGAVATADDLRAAALAGRLFALIRDRFVHPRTHLPRHSVARYRANIVSFGSLVYFLRAMDEYAERFGSEEARKLFVGGVEHALAIQGPDGEWPWMIDAQTGMPFDLYPVFTVHQDSMAMLFLFPARRRGVSGIDAAIERSFRWNLGSNEMGTSLVRREECFWVCRSIERAEGNPRLRRYLRRFAPKTSGYPERSAHVRVNEECRSYHLGWVLFAWSGYPTVPGPA